MARNIRFRAWDVRNKKMYGIVDKIDFLISGEYIRARAVVSEIETHEMFRGYNNEDRFILMQYIGFNDLNNKEIYEGDIISVDIESQTAAMTMQDDWVMAVVEWDHAGFMAAIESDEGKVLTEIQHNTVVMGNIYENPDLLQ